MQASVGHAACSVGLLVRPSIQQGANTFLCHTPVPALSPVCVQIIILLVDALRFDFIAPGSDREVNNEMPYARELLRRRDGSSALFRFISDPPTVTAARLKGITTGSMPTFFDVSDSFASPAVKEDNWVLQAQRAGWCVYIHI